MPNLKVIMNKYEQMYLLILYHFLSSGEIENMKISTVEIRDKYEVYFKDRYDDGYKTSVLERIGSLLDYLKGEGGLIQEVGQRGF
ncbi:hypothetical protein [Sporosarcina highlanderae]|uniref:Core-binding (CB) domain-containing protein n=1 Tax=Sporosarcina highlanderae TaxID=3035916 RepID=A0ABT8JL75_9BACL|nr:hypothetical protein [Sporosarcina highlanderae]MDN4605900.1 hypothetical protein [Sporosarcina highlanderae]